jgi:hypothetical protein
MCKWESEHHFWGFPQVILSLSQSVPNKLSHLFCGHKFHKIVNYFIVEMLKKKNWANFNDL